MKHMRMSATSDEGNRRINVSIGLEHVPYIVRDIKRLAEEANREIGADTTLHALLSTLEAYGHLGIGGVNKSIFPTWEEKERREDIVDQHKMTGRNWGASVQFASSEPGDGRRYTAALVRWYPGEPAPVLGHCGAVSNGWLVVCGLNGRTYLLQQEGQLYWPFIAEKFDLPENQAKHFTDLLCVYLERPGLGTIRHGE